MGRVTSNHGDQQALTLTIQRAQRRVVINQALAQAATGLAITLLGPVLLLLLGRQLAAPLLVIFAAAGIAFAAWQWWRAVPCGYRVAQALDQRLGSHDQISTAVHFLERDEPAAIQQRQAAAGIAGVCDPESVFPFTMPRPYALASVMLVGLGLLGLRYWLEKPLNFDRPLTAMLLNAIRGAPTAEQQPAEHQRPEQGEKREAAFESQSPELGRRGQGEQGSPTAESPDAADKNQTGDSRDSGDAVATTEELEGMMAGNGENDPIQSYEDMLERDAKAGLSKPEGKDTSSNEQQGHKPANSEGDSNSLLSKLREAMRNMLSRFQTKLPQTGRQEMASASQGLGEQQEGNGDGRSGDGQPQAGEKGGAEAEGGPEGAKSGSEQSGTGKEGGKSGDGARGDAGKGAGNQEGDKQLRAARELEAFGKLTELYGRRAANVAGEITVETQPGKQTLRTPLGQSNARHADSGGEISRDEIPLAYQAFVKEYFQKIHQTPKK